eukprot:5154465-Amphidinium_carterae.1
MSQQKGRPGKWGKQAKNNQQPHLPNRQTRKDAAGTSWDCPASTFYNFGYCFACQRGRRIPKDQRLVDRLHRLQSQHTVIEDSDGYQHVHDTGAATKAQLQSQIAVLEMGSAASSSEAHGSTESAVECFSWQQLANGPRVGSELKTQLSQLKKTEEGTPSKVTKITLTPRSAASSRPCEDY